MAVSERSWLGNFALISEEYDEANPFGYSSQVTQFPLSKARNYYTVSVRHDYNHGVNQVVIYLANSQGNVGIYITDGRLNSFSESDDKGKLIRYGEPNQISDLRDKGLINDADLEALATGKTLDSVATFRETVNHIDQAQPTLVFK